MKTRFAKLIDGTLGFTLMYIAVFAVLCYYIPKSFAALTALSFCSALFIIFGFKERVSGNKLKLTQNASAMFFDFLFEPSSAPAKLLKSGLSGKGITASIRGSALYTNGAAAFFHFGQPPTQSDIAKDMAKAKKYGAAKILIFTETPAPPFPQIDGYEIISVAGDDVYKLFRSLDCLPEHKFEKKNKLRFSALRSALSKDKIPRYFLLSAGLFAVAYFTSSIVCTVCAAIAAVLFVSSIVFGAVKTKKHGTN